MDLSSRTSKPASTTGKHSQNHPLLATTAAAKPSYITLPLPLHVTNVVFFGLFFSVIYYRLSRWGEKIRTSTPLHLISPAEMAAVFALVTSFLYLVGFFGGDFLHLLILRLPTDIWTDEKEEVDERIILTEDSSKVPCGQALDGVTKPSLS